MKPHPLLELCGPERILADFVCDMAGVIERIVFLDSKLGIAPASGILVEDVHPAFVGAVRAMRSSGSWLIPLLEWSRDMYVALDMRMITQSISVRMYDFSKEAIALREAQQRINEIRVSPPSGFDPAQLPDGFTAEITTYLSLFARDQARVFEALERLERSTIAPSTLFNRRVLGRVLHADDDLMISALVRSRVEKLCTEYRWVRNGRDAVEAFARQYYDFVVLDFQMPVLDGISAAEEISRLSREIHGGKTPALVLLSGSLDSGMEPARAKGIFRRLVAKSRCMDLDDILYELALEKGPNAGEKAFE